MVRPLVVCVALTGFACAPRQYTEGSDDILVRDRRAVDTVRIHGRVHRRNSERPLAGALVQIYMTQRLVRLEVVTDAKGEFRARGFPAGDIGVCVEHGAGWRRTGFQARRGQRFDVTVALPVHGDDSGMETLPCHAQFQRR